MAETKISWTHRPRPDGSFMPGYTFNPWVGCHKIKPECQNCYADAQVTRWGGDFGVAKITSAPYWRKPHKWNADAIAAGERHLVFCASMADVLEDLPELNAPRSWLWKLIEQTPGLVWLLLSKRLDTGWRLFPQEWFGTGWPQNVWLGGTCGHSQSYGNIEALVDIRAAIPVRFVSAEPLLEDIDLMPYIGGPYLGKVNWVITGGESTQGKRGRDCDINWIRRIDADCKRAGVAHYTKQLGSHPVVSRPDDDAGHLETFPVMISDRTGLDLDEWPIDIQTMREFPLAA
jgi:protein gp37